MTYTGEDIASYFILGVVVGVVMAIAFIGILATAWRD